MASFDIQSGVRTLQQAAGLPGARLEDLFESVTVESAWGPTIHVDYPLRDDGTPPTGILKFLKPKVTLRFKEPLPTFTVKPGGEPGETKWPWVATGAAFTLTVLGALAVVGAGTLLARRRRARAALPGRATAG